MSNFEFFFQLFESFCYDIVNYFSILFLFTHTEMFIIIEMITKQIMEREEKSQMTPPPKYPPTSPTPPWIKGKRNPEHEIVAWSAFAWIIIAIFGTMFLIYRHNNSPDLDLLKREQRQVQDRNNRKRARAKGINIMKKVK